MSGRSQTKGTKRGRSSTKAKPRLGLYVRVSRQGTREDERLRSPDFQRDLVRRVLGGSFELVDYEAEIDVSGSKTKRAILDEIIAAIEAGELDGIAIAKLDRFARLRPKDRVELIARIEDAGGVIRSASEQLDTSTPEGRFARDVFLGVARMQWEQKDADLKVAKREAIAAGRAIMTTAPFGFRFDEAHRLVVVEEEAELVRELYELRLEGWSYGSLAELFNERTGRSVSDMTTRRMLENRVYLGELHYGRREDTRLVNLDAVDAIVDVDVFEAVQRVNEERAPGRGVAVGRAKSLLAGIAICQGCGRNMSRKTTSSGRTIYKCNTTRPHRCPRSATIGLDELDAYVIERVLQELGPVVDEDVEVELGATVDAALAEQRLERAQAAVIAYETDVELEERLGAEAYEAGREARLELVERRRAELDAAGEQTEIQRARTTLRRELTDGEATVDERRRLLAVVVDAVVVERTPRRGAPAAERAEVVFATATAADEARSKDLVELAESAAA
jgi:DNA invertase Pin-like site-specific DNA recombinase/fructose-specific phosphotransferase system component IIB